MSLPLVLCEIGFVEHLDLKRATVVLGTTAVPMCSVYAPTYCHGKHKVVSAHAACFKHMQARHRHNPDEIDVLRSKMRIDLICLRSRGCSVGSSSAALPTS